MDLHLYKYLLSDFFVGEEHGTLGPTSLPLGSAHKSVYLQILKKI